MSEVRLDIIRLDEVGVRVGSQVVDGIQRLRPPTGLGAETTRAARRYIARPYGSQESHLKDFVHILLLHDCDTSKTRRPAGHRRGTGCFYVERLELTDFKTRLLHHCGTTVTIGD